MIRSAVIALAAAVVIAAPAQASCWKADQVAAAKVRDMETMLMVSALRCRGNGGTMLTRYNQFVVQSRSALVEVNNQLRAHFVESVGAGRAMTAYDVYVTKVANRYGAGADGLSCEDMSSITDAALAEETSFDALSALADRAGVQPILNGPVCAVTMASR